MLLHYTSNTAAGLSLMATVQCPWPLSTHCVSRLPHAPPSRAGRATTAAAAPLTPLGTVAAGADLFNPAAAAAATAAGGLRSCVPLPRPFCALTLFVSIAALPFNETPSTASQLAQPVTTSVSSAAAAATTASKAAATTSAGHTLTSITTLRTTTANDEEPSPGAFSSSTLAQPCVCTAHTHSSHTTAAAGDDDKAA